MAYQTGTVTSAADLISAIRTFAVANGWALAADVLSKGEVHVRITTPAVTELRIEGAKNGNFAAPDICGRYARIYNASWPSVATYHFAALTNPDTIWCTINFGVTDHQHLGFGMLQKYGTWAGGMWFHAQHTENSTASASLLDGGARAAAWNTGATYSNECGLFWNQTDRDNWGNPPKANKSSLLHCELRGEIWPAMSADSGGGLNDTFHRIHCPSILAPTQRYNPNVFNGQTVLTPFELFLQNTDGHYMSIGHVGHLRFVMLTNYNPGDVITIGSDRWKLFPWFRKDAAAPGGGEGSSYSTGILGVAVSYDGV